MAIKCQICGKRRCDENMFGDVCKYCVDDFRHNYKVCNQIANGAKDKQSIEINSFLLSMFSPADIEEVLMDRLDECAADASVAEKATDCGKWIDEDIHWFAEQLIKQGVTEYDK